MADTIWTELPEEVGLTTGFEWLRCRQLLRDGDTSIFGVGSVRRSGQRLWALKGGRHKAACCLRASGLRRSLHITISTGRDSHKRHTAHCTPHTAHRTLHTARHRTTPHTVHRTSQNTHLARPAHKLHQAAKCAPHAPTRQHAPAVVLAPHLHAAAFVAATGAGFKLVAPHVAAAVIFAAGATGPCAAGVSAGPCAADATGPCAADAIGPSAAGTTGSCAAATAADAAADIAAPAPAAAATPTAPTAAEQGGNTAPASATRVVPAVPAGATCSAGISFGCAHPWRTHCASQMPPSSL
eukprot:366092-Chlamydomonas_euryale.AAC.19